MSNQPHFSNSKVELKYVISKDNPVQISSWLNIPNGWDDASNRPIPMTEAQKDVVARIQQMIIDNNVNLSITIKSRSGQEASKWPTVMNARLFANDGAIAPVMNNEPNDDIPF